MTIEKTFDVTSQAMPVLDALAELNAISARPSAFIGLIHLANKGQKTIFESEGLSVIFARSEGAERQVYLLTVQHGSGPTGLTVTHITPRGNATATDPFAWAKLESAAKKIRQAIEAG